MNPELKKIIEEKIAQKSPGTFYLGHGTDAQEVRFDGTSFFLQQEHSLRWFPASNDLCANLAPTLLDSLLAGWYVEPRDLGNLLGDIPTLNEKQRNEILVAQRNEELIESFLLSGEIHLFEPEQGNGPCSENGVAAGPFQQLLEYQIDISQQSNKVLPSAAELLVLSPSGVSARDQNNSWAFSRIAMLIDGFRTIHEIETDSPFSPSATRHQLAMGAQNGWVYKTNFPELERIQFDTMDEESRAEIRDQLEVATTMAADPILILEKLHQLHNNAGDQEGIKSTEMRIVEAHRCARNPEVAIELLEKLIAENPRRKDARELLTQIQVGLGEELLSGSQPEEGRRYLRSAISSSDDDQLRMRLIASHENISLQIREGVRMASLLYRNSKQERAICLIDNIESLHPDSDEMHRAKIDFLLDHGENEAAEQALKKLAAELASLGSLKQAREVVESVRRLRRKNDQRDNHWNHGQRALRRVRQLILLLPFLIITALVAKTEFELQKVIADADTMAPHLWKQEASPWLRWLPPGPWKVGLENAANLVEERSVDQKLTYSTAAQEALQRAHHARILGHVDEMNEELQKAARFGAGTESKSLARQWQREDQQAMELRNLVEAARKRTDLAEARRLTIELLQQHPANDASIGLTIPIKIQSDRNTFLIDKTGNAIALPCWIEVEPYRSRTVILEREGRRSEFVISTQGSETVSLPGP